MQSHSWQTNNKTDLSLNRIEKAKEEKRKEQQNMKAKKSYGKKWEIVPELLIHHLPIKFDRH